MKRSWLVFGVLAILVAAGYGRYRQYPLPNLPAQSQRAKCATFFATRPTLTRTATFLKGQSIDYNQLSNSEIFGGNTSTNFQRQHQKEIGSEVVFRIYDIKKPLCGRVDTMFIVSFGKRGQVLKAENIDWACCCLDF